VIAVIARLDNLAMWHACVRKEPVLRLSRVTGWMQWDRFPGVSPCDTGPAVELEEFQGVLVA